MNIPWWEWEELQACILERPDMWLPHPTQANTYFRQVDETPAYALVAMPGPGTSEFRQVQLLTQPITWSEADVADHISYLRNKFTSWPFRDEVERFLIFELKLDPKLAYKAAIVIGRIQQGPVLEPLPEKIAYPDRKRFAIRDGGVFWFSQQGEMLRVRMELTRRYAEGWSPCILDGFVRVRGRSVKQAVQWLMGEEYVEPTKEGPLEVQMELADGHEQASEPTPVRGEDRGGAGPDDVHQGPGEQGDQGTGPDPGSGAAGPGVLEGNGE